MNLRITILASLLVFFVGCAKNNIMVKDYAKSEIIHYSEISNEEAAEQIFYLNEGDKIPVSITIESEVLALDTEQINLILKKKVYFRLVKPEWVLSKKEGDLSDEEKAQLQRAILIYLSADAKQWAPYTDIKAIKSLFGIKGGSLSIGTEMKNGQSPRISIRVITKNE